MSTLNYTFNINQQSVPLESGEKLIFKLILNSTSTNNFTASIGQGNLYVASNAVATGYATTNCPYLSSASIATGSNNNEIVFSSGVSSYHDNGYTFIPNPLSGSISSSLYPIYGDVDYPFIIKPYDILLIYLSDGTYIESRVLKVYKDSSNLLRLTLDTILSSFIKEDLVSGKFRRLLLLTRVEDESNAYVVYQKRPGQTSYGFIIPQNLSSDILDNIDVITKEVKQKLLADQQGNSTSF
jgi:hypothetical protein